MVMVRRHAYAYLQATSRCVVIYTAYVWSNNLLLSKLHRIDAELLFSASYTLYLFTVFTQLS